MDSVAISRGVAPVESLGTLPGRRSRKRFAEGERIASEPLVRRHTGRLQSEPTCATRVGEADRRNDEETGIAGA